MTIQPVSSNSPRHSRATTGLPRRIPRRALHKAARSAASHNPGARLYKPQRIQKPLDLRSFTDSDKWSLVLGASLACRAEASSRRRMLGPWSLVLLHMRPHPANKTQPPSRYVKVCKGINGTPLRIRVGAGNAGERANCKTFGREAAICLAGRQPIHAFAEHSAELRFGAVGADRRVITYASTLAPTAGRRMTDNEMAVDT